MTPVGCALWLLTVLLVVVSSTPAQIRKLRPSEKYWEFWAEVEGARPSVFRVTLPRHRQLVSVGDKLYLLNKKNRILWSSVAAAPISNSPVVDSEGTIYVVGWDMLWAAFDSKTGKQKWHTSAVGRGAFTQIKLYRKDTYFVVTDMFGYRDSLRNPTIKDKLSLCRKNAVLWEIEIPAHTKLHVFGNKVFLTYKRHGRLVRNRVLVPRKFGKPLSRISVPTL